MAFGDSPKPKVPTAEESRLACERFREHLRVCLAMEHPVNNPYTHVEVSTGAAQYIPEACERDIITLAHAYLRDHPTDDNEPLTARWLEAHGFKRDAADGDGNIWFVIGLPNAEPGYSDPSLWLCDANCNLSMNGEYGMDMPTPKTRGDVRKLCQALGVTLKE